MKNLIIRSISGLVYVSLIIGGILLGQLAFACVFIIFAILANWEFLDLGKHKEIYPEKITVLLSGISLYTTGILLAMHYFDYRILFINIPFVLAILIAELFRNKPNPALNISYSLFSLAYIIVPVIILSFIFKTDLQLTGNSHSSILLGIFIILWIYDSGAYLFGIAFGKHKLFEKISPKKTWEGFLGGAIVSLVAAYLYAKYFTQIEAIHIIHIALIIIVFGTFGDLIESMIKRNFNVKDSGKIMPGHGGILDRIDSILISSPMVYLYTIFFF